MLINFKNCYKLNRLTQWLPNLEQQKDEALLIDREQEDRVCDIFVILAEEHLLILLSCLYFYRVEKETLNR